MIEVVFDCEAESLNLALCRPWQLAYIVAKDGKIIKKVNDYIDIHDLNVSKDAARVTGFDFHEYNRLKIPAKEVFSKFEKYLYNDGVRFIGHNLLGYDWYIVSNLAEYVGSKLDFNKFIYRTVDTLCLARAQHFQSPAPKNKYDFLSWQYKHLHKHDKTIKCSLSALAKRNDIIVDETKTHDALYDVILTYDVYRKMKYSLDF